ncbi:MAG: DUF5711 family protein [Tissierellia bacterium]|nr:DUF5711 family protein [Tissierellia bacterium]
MKKKIYFLMFFLFILFVVLYFVSNEKFVFNFDNNMSYEIKNKQIVEINVLDNSKFFCDGIITYNNQKIIYLDYNNNIVWENQNRIFTDKIFIGKDYIFRYINKGIEYINKNNQTYMSVELSGEVVFVSRETKKIYIITDQKNGQNSLYIIDDNNEFFVDNKIFSGIITNVTIDDKIDRYCVTTLNITNDNLVNSLSFNHLIVASELWNIEITDELIVGTEIINNNVLVIGTKNIYLYNEQGKLMWKNINYSTVMNYVINRNEKKIYILFKKNDKFEIVCYNYNGKVSSINKVPLNVEKIGIFNNRIFVYNEKTIYLLHNDNCYKLIDVNEGLILDFYVDNKNIHILTKDKLIKGQIR